MGHRAALVLALVAAILVEFEVPREAKGAALSLTAVKHGYQSAQKTYPSLPGSAQDVCVAPTLR